MATLAQHDVLALLEHGERSLARGEGGSRTDEASPALDRVEELVRVAVDDQRRGSDSWREPARCQ